jgi:hypothetical protein
MKAALQAVFFIMSVYRLIVVGAGTVGYTRDVLVVPLYAIPGAVCALVLGHLLSKRTSAELFRKTAYAVLGLIGLIILIRGAKGLIL